jgi:hypothetical protein
MLSGSSESSYSNDASELVDQLGSSQDLSEDNESIDGKFYRISTIFVKV